jgi:tetrahydromethanopterin S-methyltransferase subunit A
VGGSIDATEDDRVSVVAAPVTGNTAVSEADMSEVVTKVECDGIGCPVSSLYVALKSGNTVPESR